ncbi:hypothetical protein WDW37_01185 [Bdellovibrionota bacterium FG-1]
MLKDVFEKAKRKAKLLQKLRQDPRYLKTIGKLKREGLLDVRDIPKYRGQVFLKDAIWAAQLEPRIFELLPAIITRRPSLFVFFDLPPDLKQVTQELKAGHAHSPYQGISPEKYQHWLSFVGRTNSRPKIMKSFRLSQEDLALLRRLTDETALTQTEVLQIALRDFAKGKITDSKESW